MIQFIGRSPQDIYYLTKKALKKNKGHQKCELRVETKKGDIIWVFMEFEERKNSFECKCEILVSISPINKLTENKEKLADI